MNLSVRISLSLWAEVLLEAGGGLMRKSASEFSSWTAGGGLPPSGTAAGTAGGGLPLFFLGFPLCNFRPTRCDWILDTLEFELLRQKRDGKQWKKVKKRGTEKEDAMNVEGSDRNQPAAQIVRWSVQLYFFCAIDSRLNSWFKK